MNQFGIALRESDRHMGRGTPPGEPGTVIDFERVLAGLRRQRWIYAFWILVMCILAIAITVTTPPAFRASATLMMTEDPRLDSVGAAGAQGTSTPDNMQTAEQIFRSRALALQVTDRLNLQEDVGFMNQPVAATTVLTEGAMAAAREAIDSAVALVGGTEDIPEGPPVSEAEMAEAERQAAARSLQSDISVRQLGRSTAMEVAFTLHDPFLAAEIVNTYSDAYITDQLTAAFERSAVTTEWLQQRLDQLEDESRQAATDVQQYRIENDLVTVRDALVSEGNVDRFNVELTEALAEAARIRARVRAYEAALTVEPEALAEDDALRLSLPGNEQLNALRDTLNGLRARRAEVVRDFGLDHPQVQAIDRRIDDAARRLHSEMERQVEVARGELTVAERQVASLQQALDPVVATNAEAARALVDLRLLEQRAESLGRLHETFLTEFQQAGQLASFPVANVRILTAADVPVDPISPSKRQAVLLAIILGLLAGTAHAFWREWRDRSIRTGRDVIDGLGQPFLGNLPLMDQSDKLAMGDVEAKAAKSNRPDDVVRSLQQRPRPTKESIGMPVVDYPLASLADPNSPYCETLRRIRNAVQRAGPGQGSRVVGITSLLSGEGKTHVGTDLADILSLQCGPTLLMDCDFRNLSLSRAVSIGNGIDVRDVLDGKVDWRRSLVRIGGTNVDVLGWDQSFGVGEPSELLGSDRMLGLIDDAATQYRTVVLDLPAIGPTVDVKELLPAIDQVLLLAQWGRTSATELQRVLDTEPELRGRMIGVVLNKVNMRQLRSYVEPNVTENFRTYGS
jgi:succinoglycan biosynthesis transport protein ExoP